MRCVFIFVSEPTERLPVEEIQEYEWLAEALGRLHKLLSFLLQNLPGKEASSF